MPVGFVFGASVKIYNDISAVLVTADVKSVFVILAGVGERKQVCNAACWENTLKFCAESVLAVGLNAFIAYPLRFYGALGCFAFRSASIVNARGCLQSVQ